MRIKDQNSQQISSQASASTSRDQELQISAAIHYQQTTTSHEKPHKQAAKFQARKNNFCSGVSDYNLFYHFVKAQMKTTKDFISICTSKLDPVHALLSERLLKYVVHTNFFPLDLTLFLDRTLALHCFDSWPIMFIWTSLNCSHMTGTNILSCYVYLTTWDLALCPLSMYFICWCFNSMGITIYLPILTIPHVLLGPQCIQTLAFPRISSQY